MQLDVVTPDRIVVSEDADKVVCPGYDGECGILPGHVTFITKLKTGEVSYYGTESKRNHYLIVTGGYIEVTKDKIVILADWCIRSRDIDKVQAELDLNKADETIKTAEKNSPEYLKAKDDHELSRAILKLYEKIG